VEWEHVDVLGSSYSNPDDGAADGSQLLGRGKVLGATERVNLGVDAAVEEYIREFEPAGWSLDVLAGSTVTLYSSAQAEGSELLHSVRYTRARSRVSYNVLCRFWEGELGDSSSDVSEPEVPTYYIGRINFFVKVTPPDAMDVDFADEGGAESLRLAVMDLHLVQRIDSGVGIIYQSVTYCSGSTACEHPNYALSLCYDEDSYGTIISKQVMAQDDKTAFFVPYSNMSASGQDD
jgi:hypothetical protein